MEKAQINTRYILKRMWFCLASSYAGLLVLWSIVFIGGVFNQNWLNLLFWEGAVFYSISFILLPIIYWRFYIVLAWIINIVFLVFLTLVMIKLAFTIESDPSYLQNNERIWGPGFHFMHFALFGVTSFFVCTLWKPALFYFHKLRGR